MRSADTIEKQITNFTIDVNPDKDRQMLDAILETQAHARRSSRVDVWRLIMKSSITQFAAAAILLAALITIYQFTGSIDGASIAWGSIVESVQTAKSIQYKVTYLKDNQPYQETQIIYVAPYLLYEHVLPDGMTTVWNYNDHKRLMLYPNKKEATIIEYMNMTGDSGELPEDIKKHFTEGLWERFFSQEYENSRRLLGHEEIDGQAADIFVATGLQSQMKVWADRETGLLIRAEVTRGGSALSDGAPSHYVFSDFVWNGPVAESVLNLEVPEGYHVNTYHIDVSNPTEKALVEGLRSAAQLSGGQFPEAWTDKALSKIMMDSMTNNSAVPFTQEQKIAIYEKIKMIDSGFKYVQTLKDDDWQYSGSGVKLGDADAVIFRLRPNGCGPYRVIYGDLHIEVSMESPQ